MFQESHSATLPQQLLMIQSTGGDEYHQITSARGSFQLRPSRDSRTRRSLAMAKGSKNMSQIQQIPEKGVKSSRNSVDSNEEIAKLKKQRRLFGESTFTTGAFNSPISYTYRQQIDNNQFQFQQIDQLMEEDPTYAEPDFIKQHREEFELFLAKNRPDLNERQLFQEEFMKLNGPVLGSLSSISTFYRQKRCPRYVRNFGSLAPSLPVQDYAPTSILGLDSQERSPQKFQMPSIDNKSHFKNGTQLYKPTGGNILLSSQSSLMQSYTKLLIPTLDKEKLRQELNQLVAYRHRKLQILEKLEADLAQIRFTNSQANVFNPSLTYRGAGIGANSPLRDKYCCSPTQERKSPTKMLMMSSSRGMKKSMGMTLTNLQTFDIEKGFRSTGLINQDQKLAAYSRKSQFGHNSIEINDQNKNVQATTMPDDFSIVDMEFRKVQLLAKLNTKDQEFDEANLENQSLSYQLEKEKRQNLINKKAFNKLLPNFEEYEAIGYRFQHIEALNYFRKFVAEHSLAEKTTELLNNHQDHKYQINKLLDQLKGEREQLHVLSMQLQSREQDLQQIKFEIKHIRNQAANLGSIKKKWVNFLRIRYREYRIIRILRIFYLIPQLKNTLNISSGSGSIFQQANSFHRDSREDITKQVTSSKSVEEIKDIPDDEDQQDERQQIFNELQSLLLKFTQTTDFPSFCGQILSADMPDLIKFFQEDAVLEQQYAEVHDKLSEREVTAIYNQSQFAIASLQVTHDNLMQSKEKKKLAINQMNKMKLTITYHKDEIVEYLANSHVAERNDMDMTVDDMYNLRQVQAKYLNQTKQALAFLIPQIRSHLAHTNQNVELFEKAIQSKIEAEHLLSNLGQYLIVQTAKNSMVSPTIAIEAIEEANKDMQSLNLDETNNQNLAHSESKTNIKHGSQDDNISPEKVKRSSIIESNKNKTMPQKNNALTGISNKGKAKLKKKTERPGSNLVQQAPTIDFNDSNQLQSYLLQQTVEALSILSTLGSFMKKCQTSIVRLQNDLNNGEPLQIDYSHYERQFHDTHYMKTLAAKLMNKDRLSTNPSVTPFGGTGINSSRGGSQFNSPHPANVHFQSDVEFGTKDSQQRQHLVTQASTAHDDLSSDPIRQQRHQLKTANTGSQSHRGGISSGGIPKKSRVELRGLYKPSSPLTDKFQKVRNLQLFDIREKQFLRQFRKRIHENYFTNPYN